MRIHFTFCHSVCRPVTLKTINNRVFAFLPFNPLGQLLADRPTRISHLLEISTNVVFGELDAFFQFKSFKAIHRSKLKIFTSWSSILHSKLGNQLLISSYLWRQFIVSTQLLTVNIMKPHSIHSYNQLLFWLFLQNTNISGQSHKSLERSLRSTYYSQQLSNGA